MGMATSDSGFPSCHQLATAFPVNFFEIYISNTKQQRQFLPGLSKPNYGPHQD